MPAAGPQPDGTPPPALDLAEPGVERLLALNRAAIAITSALDLDNLLQRIVDSVRTLVGCRYAALGVLGEDGYIVRFPTSGISPTEREAIGAPPRGHGLLGVMLRAGHSLRIPDMSQDPRGVGFPPNHPPMTSLLGVPIFVQGRLMGDLYLTDKIGGPEFTEQDEWLVQLLATHAATALTNADLLEQVNRARTRTEALLRVSQAISRSVELDEAIHLILDAAGTLLDAPGAGIYLLEAGASRADTLSGARYAIGIQGDFVTTLAELPLERTVAGRVVTQGTTHHVADTRAEPDLVLPRLAGGEEIRSILAVPLRIETQLIGALACYGWRPGRFDPAAAELLEAFGTQVSTVLGNARLYEEAQRGRAAAEREQHRLEELEHMKDEFLSTAAHELRTPLTTVRMSAGLALEQLQALAAQPDKPVVDPRIVNLVELTVESSERMQSLVNDLLDLTRLEQGGRGLVMADVDMRDVITAVIGTVQPLLESKAQKLVLHLPEARYLVRGDRVRLEQVLINLLSNAHKYSGPGSQIEVRALRTGNEVQVLVRDNGPGIPADEREHIFERFYRSSRHRQDRTASTGLGLPIARTIAELHRGRLWADAAPGGGSIFTLALPIKA